MTAKKVTVCWQKMLTSAVDILRDLNKLFLANIVTITRFSSALVSQQQQV